MERSAWSTVKKDAEKLWNWSGLAAPKSVQATMENMAHTMKRNVKAFATCSSSYSQLVASKPAWDNLIATHRSNPSMCERVGLATPHALAPVRLPWSKPGISSWTNEAARKAGAPCQVWLECWVGIDPAPERISCMHDNTAGLRGLRISDLRNRQHFNKN